MSKQCRKVFYNSFMKIIYYINCCKILNKIHKKVKTLLIYKLYACVGFTETFSRKRNRLFSCFSVCHKKGFSVDITCKQFIYRNFVNVFMVFIQRLLPINKIYYIWVFEIENNLFAKTLDYF